MRKLSKQQWLEQGIYGVLWFVVFLFPLIGARFAVRGGLEQDAMAHIVCNSWLSLIPFFVLFLLNNYGLVPFLLFQKRYGRYIVSLVFAIGILVLLIPPSPKARFPKGGQMTGEYLSMHENKRDRIIEEREKVREKESVHWESKRELEEEADGRALDQELRSPTGKPMRSGQMHAPLPFPPFAIRYLVHILTAFLMAGFNIAIKLFFKSLRDEELMKELENQHLQSELQYLKYQINPHFFMNTLNNIHALVDIDTKKAKSSIVELAKLMRYVLYEASHKTIMLSREIQFLENYIALMKLRFTDKVAIQINRPQEVPEVQIPPLLFVSFVENAFKHGISYQVSSYIHVHMQIEEGNRLSFRCTNSNGGKSDEQHHGIGLENIRKRLRLLYGNDYTLSITQDDTDFDVLLIIPLYIE